IVDDLFAYKVGVVEDFYFSCVKQPCDDLENGDLDVYEPRQCYDEYERMFAEAVILIDNRLAKLIDITLEQYYRKPFKEYMEIKRRLEVNGIHTDVECDPTNKIRDDEKVLTYDKLSDLEEENLCEEFKEFDHLLQIDVDVLTGDLPRFKMYEDYKNTWIYEWNNKEPWVDENPWLEDGTWKDPTNDICHECKPFGFKSGHVEWPTCNWKDDGYCNGGDLPGVIRVGNMVYFQDYEWYKGLEDGDLKDEALKEKATLKGSWGHENRKGKKFCSWLKESFGNYDELDYELMLKLKEYWWGKKEEDESSEDAWSNYLPRTRINNDNDAIQANQERFDDHEPMKDDDDDIGDLGDYLIPNYAPYYVDKEEERFKERRSKLLGIPYKKPPTFKSKKFKVIKYSFGPAEGYVAIKEYQYDI
ncbi:hypothetical protein Tco_1140512, partial [Tanacetum coccineum]